MQRLVPGSPFIGWLRTPSMWHIAYCSYVPTATSKFRNEHNPIVPHAILIGDQHASLPSWFVFFLTLPLPSPFFFFFLFPSIAQLNIILQRSPANRVAQELQDSIRQQTSRARRPPTPPPTATRAAPKPKPYGYVPNSQAHRRPMGRPY